MQNSSFRIRRRFAGPPCGRAGSGSLYFAEKAGDASCPQKHAFSYSILYTIRKKIATFSVYFQPDVFCAAEIASCSCLFILRRRPAHRRSVCLVRTRFRHIHARVAVRHRQHQHKGAHQLRGEERVLHLLSTQKASTNAANRMPSIRVSCERGEWRASPGRRQRRSVRRGTASGQAPRYRPR